jgi:hypothetical protein
MKTYTCSRFPLVGTFEYEADFTRAESPIWVRFPDGNDEWQVMPFQVANTAHNGLFDQGRAEEMIADYFG